MNQAMNKKIFIGLAWPYANGSLHLGHVSAFIGADIIARYHRLAGNDVLFVSGSDCYGTPIAVEAAEKGISPSEIASKYHEEFKETLISGMGFSCDIYTKTTTDQHSRVVQEIFLDLHKKGFLYTKTAKALFSPFLGRFLPDRFIEGICPKCAYTSARGDQCDECGALLDPLELKEPKINPKILTRQKELTANDLRLEARESEHFYLKLSAIESIITEWVEKKSGLWRANARNFTKSFLQKGLHDRAITRDTDWGVTIPLPGYEDKKIYVWFEAVLGYLSASKLWAQEKGTPEEWEKFWLNDESTHYYVHGKDNIPFHTIILPAILLTKGKLNTPDYIISSEYLTLEGKQFSKSRNWAVWLPEFLESFDSDTLRYFLIVNGPETSDANFSWSEYALKVNGELIGTFGNLVNRVFTFGQKNFPEGLHFPEAIDAESKDLLELAEKAFTEIGDLITEGKFRAAFRLVFNLAEHGNRFIHKREPWIKLRDIKNKQEVESDIAVLAHLVKSLGLLIAPFMPKTSENICDTLGLNQQKQGWNYPQSSKVQIIGKVSTLYKKVDDSAIKDQYDKLGKLSGQAVENSST